ncbi:MAG: DUF459 domain-containing protein [Acidimicrobiia bacterium]
MAGLTITTDRRRPQTASAPAPEPPSTEQPESAEPAAPAGPRGVRGDTLTVTGRRRDRRKAMSAAQVILVTFVALTLGLLLNADGIMRTAESQPAGWQRSASVALMKPVVAVSGGLGMNRLRSLIDGDRPQEESDAVIVAPAPTIVADPLALAREADGVIIMGDSMANDMATPLSRDAEQQGITPISTVYKPATGLARPDEYNWPAKATKVLGAANPKAVVVQFGGNDGQDMAFEDGTRIRFGTDEWTAEYARRVGIMMDIVSGPWQRPVVWVGLPIPRASKVGDRFEIMNGIYESEAARRPNITFVDIYRTFADSGGSYADYLADPAGKTARMRAGDGIHMTLEGAKREASKVLPALEKSLTTLAARLEAAPPPTTAPAATTAAPQE